MTDFERESTNLVQLLATAVARHTDRRLFGTPRDEGAESVDWTSFIAFSDAVDRFRAGLHSLGVRRGDGVAVLSDNRVEWAVGAFATFGLGAFYVPIHELTDDFHLEHMLADSEACVCLVANPAIARRVKALCGSLPKLRVIVSLTDSSADTIGYRDLLARGAALPVHSIVPNETELAALMYTWGTTGMPKGVMLSHLSLATNLGGLKALDLTPDDRFLSLIPWPHVLGLLEMMLVVVTGASTVLSSDPRLGMRQLPAVRPTILLSVPRLWNWLFQQLKEPTNLPAVRNALGGRLRVACSGGAALDPAVAESIEALGIAMHSVYGTTEAGGCTTVQRYDPARAESVGRPIPGMRISIAHDVPFGGEVIVHGRGLMSGYWRRPEESQYAFTDDGGLFTGDLGRVDDEGHLYLFPRLDNLYTLDNGVQIQPYPLEETLYCRTPYIEFAYVNGANRPYNVAVIVPDLLSLARWAETQGLAATGEPLLLEPSVRRLLEDEVRAVNQGWSSDQRICRFVVDPEWPSMENGLVTPSGQKKRRAIQRHYDAVLASLYTLPGAEDRSPLSWHIQELRPSKVR